MKTKRFFGGLLAMIMVAAMAFVAAPSAYARVSSSMNGTYYKNVSSQGGEYLSINYNPSTGRVTASYCEGYYNGVAQSFQLSGRASGGYLVVSGRGYSRGRITTMKVKIAQVDYNCVKVVTQNGRSYFWYR